MSAVQISQSGSDQEVTGAKVLLSFCKSISNYDGKWYCSHWAKWRQYYCTESRLSRLISAPVAWGMASVFVSLILLIHHIVTIPALMNTPWGPDEMLEKGLWESHDFFMNTRHPCLLSSPIWFVKASALKMHSALSSFQSYFIHLTAFKFPKQSWKVDEKPTIKGLRSWLWDKSTMNMRP